MSERAGRALAASLLVHETHELFDPAQPAELTMLERLIGTTLPPSYRGLLLVGSGGVLDTGELLLGTQDPEQLGATIQDLARELWADGLEKRYLPIVDGEGFFCLDLERRDDAGECPVVEIDAETMSVRTTCGDFVAFARARWLAG